MAAFIAKQMIGNQLSAVKGLTLLLEPDPLDLHLPFTSLTPN